jgi:hypothetical protein
MLERHAIHTVYYNSICCFLLRPHSHILNNGEDHQTVVPSTQIDVATSKRTRIVRVFAKKNWTRVWVASACDV